MRLRPANDAPLRPDGRYVLYWMIAARRTRWNFSLQRAVERARELGKPLVVLEALRVDYPFAADRFHRFILDGMRANGARLAKAGVRYHPYVESRRGDGKGLLAALARDACVVVTDESPAFFLPRMVRAAAAPLTVRLETVDSDGLLPLVLAERTFRTAHSFRTFLQRRLPEQLGEFPLPDPLRGLDLPRAAALPVTTLRRWTAATAKLLAGSGLERLPIDHGVPAVETRGGSEEGGDAVRRFLDERLDRYLEDRNHPDVEGTSGLSPYLHFGHVSAHEIFAATATREGWHEGKLSGMLRGARSGWWGMSAPAEAFLDQLITWRELGRVQCARQPDCDRWETLPAWARATLERHAGDPREHEYDLPQLEAARTHDPLWNAAQTQLVREGRMHNYLRMLWGKKILEWSPTPQEALARMLRLNDRWALDGRDPSSIAGAAWVLGRYDRAWGPERPEFGTIRYMSSANTLRKVRARETMRRYAP
jgi:deoxyribodipyrimidine photo-lyase